MFRNTSRGESTNSLFADRTSTSWLRSNQIRLYFSTVAYQLLQALRRLGLAGTELGVQSVAFRLIV